MVRVKICGITSIKDLQVAVEAGVDALGFVVDTPQSPRNISLERAEELIKAAPIFIERVIVTVLKDPARLERIYKKLNPDIIQIHGSTSMFRKVRERLPDARIIGAVHLRSDFTVNEAVDVAAVSDAILTDAYVPGMYGGTGVPNDWKTCKCIREAVHPKPLILAGGLKPENVKDAISIVKPYAVDVSSGVELQPGVKDPWKIFAFVKNVREVKL